MVRKWKSDQADVVYTVRTRRDQEPALKMFATAIGYRIIRKISTIDMPIESGDFKLMSRRVVDHVVRLREKEPFLRGLVRWVGFKQVPVFYNREGRFGGETHFIFYKPKVLKNFLSGITSFSDAPLYLTFALGLTVAGSSFIYLTVVVAMKLMGLNEPGLSAVMAIVLFLGGVQILAIGVLGLYIAKIHIEVKGRPNYIVSDTVGLSDSAIAVKLGQSPTPKSLV
jgi:dolichol-phosphate mannosyltransferase